MLRTEHTTPTATVQTDTANLVNFYHISAEGDGDGGGDPPDGILFAYCDLCNANRLSSESVLTKCGWGLYGEFQFCPACEDEI